MRTFAFILSVRVVLCVIRRAGQTAVLARGGVSRDDGDGVVNWRGSSGRGGFVSFFYPKKARASTRRLEKNEEEEQR